VAAAQKTQGGPQPQRVADAERSFASTMAKRDAKGFAAHISEEAIFMGSSDAPRVLHGRAAIVEGWKQFFDGPTAPFSWEPDIAEVLDSGSSGIANWAFLFSAGTFKLLFPAHASAAPGLLRSRSSGGWAGFHSPSGFGERARP
jgi:ketosteroid isomerase-like protein